MAWPETKLRRTRLRFPRASKADLDWISAAGTYLNRTTTLEGDVARSSSFPTDRATCDSCWFRAGRRRPPPLATVRWELEARLADGHNSSAQSIILPHGLTALPFVALA